VFFKKVGSQFYKKLIFGPAFDQQERRFLNGIFTYLLVIFSNLLKVHVPAVSSSLFSPGNKILDAFTVLRAVFIS
jgi:hypothetical protein